MFIKDPLYGYLRFADEIREIIDTPEFQRLRRIQQLFGSDFVYPGAAHTRAEHSLGTAYLAKKMVDSIEDELKRRKGEGIGEKKKKAVILGALLHDVGHGPFSHSFEPYLSKFDLNHEDFTKRIILERLAPKIENIGTVPELVAEIAGGIESKKTKSQPFLKQIVGSAVDADKLDYLRRDAYHTGAEYGFVDTERIVNFVSVFDGQICVKDKAIQSVEAMLIARALAFKSIYYHKASRSAQLLISKAIKAGAKELNLSSGIDDLSKYLSWDDRTMWAALLDTPSSEEYMRRLKNRRLLKVALSRSGSADRPSMDLLDIFASPRLREELSNSIAEEAGIQEPVEIDSPTLPNLPYHWTTGKREVPILITSPSQGEIVKPISSMSRTAKALESFLYVIRVYTVPEKRKEVRKVAKKIFSGIRKKGVDEIHM